MIKSQQRGRILQVQYDKAETVRAHTPGVIIIPIFSKQSVCMDEKDRMPRDRPSGLTSPAFHACGSAGPLSARCSHSSQNKWFHCSYMLACLCICCDASRCERGFPILHGGRVHTMPFQQRGICNKQACAHLAIVVNICDGFDGRWIHTRNSDSPSIRIRARTVIWCDSTYRTKQVLQSAITGK